MAPNPSSSSVYRFGTFEFESRTGELRKQGIKIRLEGQPVAVLTMLLQRSGNLITREELQKKLWPGDTFVDFEHSLNAAVKRLRAALNDSAESPRYVETLARRGYRFIAPVDGTAVPPVTIELPQQPASEARPRSLLWPLWVGSALLLLGLAGWGWGNWVHRVATPVPAPIIRSLAVLPLENLTGDPSQEYFADGMTDALITDLAQVSALRVISRTSVMRYKGTRNSLPDIARELGVDGIVEGTVVRSGTRVRISSQLVYGPLDQHLWAQSYERDLSDIVSLQDEVARAIANEVRASITPQQRSQLAGGRPVNPEAYELYLKGRYFWNKRTGEDLHKATEYFEQAIGKDPEFALAYVGLADAYFALAINSDTPPREAYPKAEAAAREALRLDESLSSAHAALGYFLIYYEWDFAGGERELRRATDQGTPDPSVHMFYASYLSVAGRDEEAIAEIRRNQKLDPLSLMTNSIAGRIFYAARRNDESIVQCRKALELDPTFWVAHLYQGRALEQQGKYSEAIAELRLAGRVTSEPESIIGHAYAMSGNPSKARTVLESLKKRAQTQYVPAAHIARIYAGLGDRPEAFAWLERAFQERSPWVVHIRWDPTFDPIRSDPRFTALLHRVGLQP